MQIYADVTGREIKIAAAAQTPALGSAMFGAVAAGKASGYDTIEEASAAMSRLRDEIFTPSRSTRRSTISSIRSTCSCTIPLAQCQRRDEAAQADAPCRGVRPTVPIHLSRVTMLEPLREELLAAPSGVAENDLVRWTGGNVSTRDPETGYVVIKPSGVRYRALRRTHGCP